MITTILSIVEKKRVRRPPSAVRRPRPPSAVRRPPSAVRRPPSAVRRPPSAVRRPHSPSAPAFYLHPNTSPLSSLDAGQLIRQMRPTINSREECTELSELLF